MKASYKRLAIYQALLFLFLLFNSFVSNVLNIYVTVIFLCVMLLVFKKILGFEKDRHRYTKDIILDVAIFLILFLLFYYIFGLLVGFAKVGNYYNLVGFRDFIIPIILTTVLKEILRYMMLKKSEGNNFFIIITCVLFILFDISNSIYYSQAGSNYALLVFVALVLLPSISSNIVCTYLSLKTGYKPVILYLLVMALYKYLLPIIPNPSEYVASIIELIVPFILCYRIYVIFKNENDEEVVREHKKKDTWMLVVATIIVVTLVYFVSGYFKYSAIAIATGSMEPNISRGDVVIVNKNGNNYTTIKEGDVIAFKHNQVIIVHRVVKIMKDKEEYYFYTKGDANLSEDSYFVTKDMILGTVSVRIPYIGLPTVWLKEL